MIAMLVILIAGISITTISAQTPVNIPSWVKNNAIWWGEGKISDSEFISALQYLINNGNLKVISSSSDTSILQKKVNNLETKILNLNDEISDLETENKRLWKLVDTTKSSPSYDLPKHNEIRYDFKDLKSNIGGLTISIYSFGFLEPKPDEFSIDMDIRYTRGGDLVQFEVSQIRVTTNDHFSYESDKNQFLKFNGYYQKDTINRSIVKVDDVPRELKGDFEILVFVREIENGYYIQDYIFTFPTILP